MTTNYRLINAVNQAKTDKKNSKIALAHYDAYSRSWLYDLEDCYNNYSQYKRNAYNRCLQLMSDLDGYALRIISHNSMQFTVGFEFADPDTGECMFAYITKDYDRFAYI